MGPAARRETTYRRQRPAKGNPSIRNPQSAIHITGTVSDVRPYLAQATIAVCPVLYSVGIQNKVLEAMAMGIPMAASAGAISLRVRGRIGMRMIVRLSLRP